MVSTGGVIQQLADNQYSPDHMKTLIRQRDKYHMPNRGAPDCGSKSRDQQSACHGLKEHKIRIRLPRAGTKVPRRPVLGLDLRIPDAIGIYRFDSILTFTVPYSSRAPAPRARTCKRTVAQ